MERLDLANSTEILEKLIILNNLKIWLSEPFSNKSINPKSPHQDFIFENLANFLRKWKYVQIYKQQLPC